ncbi:MAG: LON peptidase substrate-binding domain-containing protein [Ectothiorhodospiraceae bacterium]|nr:LON peptidase substrate-binding domain-containing protein [Ectothiorhodospiraceae bacterium]
MRTRRSFELTFGELPASLPVFPLPGALLLPGQRLPLNIFEPRYLAMVLDALAADRHIGMIQPDPAGAAEGPDALYAVGCAGRITAFNETEDGRLLISLKGVCRFRVGEEIPTIRGYRRVVPSWSDFAADLVEGAAPIDIASLDPLLERYFASEGLEVDWNALRELRPSVLVDFLSVSLPFSCEEKQALLEAPDCGQRASVIKAILEMSLGDGPHCGAGGTRH